MCVTLTMNDTAQAENIGVEGVYKGLNWSLVFLKYMLFK